MFFNYGEHRFNDFTDFDPVAEQFSTRQGIKTQNYPAPMVCVLLAFTRTFHKPLHQYLLCMGLTFLACGIFAALALYRARANRKLLAASALVTFGAGYPFIFLLERGNTEWVIFGLNAAALAAFFMRRHLPAGLLIAAAASMKIFPGLLFALLLARKRYWELALSVAFILPLQVFSLWMIGPSIPIALESVRYGLGHLGRTYFTVYGTDIIGYDHSLFSLIKQLLHLRFRGDALASGIQAITLWYTILAIVLVVALYWFRLRKLPLLNQMAVLIILAVTLPYVSFEYTLTSMFLVWAAFVFFLSRDVSEGRETLAPAVALGILGLMAFLFAPVFYIKGGTQMYGGQVQTVALLGLMGTFLSIPMRCRLFDSV